MEKATSSKIDVANSLSPERIDLAERIFSMLTEVLNELHGTDYPERFWKLISEEHVRNCINHFELLERSFISKNNDDFRGYSFRLNFRERLRNKAASTYRYLITKKNVKLIDDAIHKNDHLLVRFSGIPLIAEETGGEEIEEAEIWFFGLGNRGMRKKAVKIAGRLDSIFNKNIILSLPELLVEQFDKIFSSITLHSPQTKTFHVRGSFSAGYRQMLIAKYLLNGSRLIWYQNGAVIGEIESKYGGYLTRSVSDEYRTWGWKQHGNDIPWKGYDLIRFGSHYDSVDSNVAEYDLLISYPKVRFEKKYFRETTQTLLKGLDKESYSNILIRTYPSKKEAPERDFGFIRDERVSLNREKTSMAKDLKSSRLTVHIDVPATTFLEAISVNHPSMGILRNSNPTDIVRPFYKFFMDIGVLHESAESLAAHLNSIDTDTWWRSVVKHDLYGLFRKRFVNSTNPPRTFGKAQFRMNGTK